VRVSQSAHDQNQRVCDLEKNCSNLTHRGYELFEHTCSLQVPHLFWGKYPPVIYNYFYRKYNFFWSYIWWVTYFYWNYNWWVWVFN
jgi:hypothetical protein